MTARRLLLVTPRFWPLVGGAPRTMAALGAEFVARGRAVTVLTANWDPAWPERLIYCGVPVVRLPYSRRTVWGPLPYLFRLFRWLRAQRRQYDLVYVSQLRYEAWTALQAASRGLPVVLQARGAGTTGDCQWQGQARGGRWIARSSRRAAAVVAPCPVVADELQQCGYPSAQVQMILPGVELPPPASRMARSAARDALGEVQPLLRLAADAPLAVCTCKLQADRGLFYLIKAWRQVYERRPQACLWLVGDGPERTALEQQIQSLGLVGRVFLTGAFDQLDEILAAADLFVFPSLQAALSLSLLEAMAAGLPIVAADTPGVRTALVDGQHGLLAPARASAPLAQAINRLLDDPPLAARLGAAARRRAEREFPLSRCVERHLELFDRVAAAQRPAASPGVYPPGD